MGSLVAFDCLLWKSVQDLNVSHINQNFQIFNLQTWIIPDYFNQIASTVSNN